MGGRGGTLPLLGEGAGETILQQGERQLNLLPTVPARPTVVQANSAQTIPKGGLKAGVPQRIQRRLGAGAGAGVGRLSPANVGGRWGPFQKLPPLAHSPRAPGLRGWLYFSPGRLGTGESGRQFAGGWEGPVA